jgi:hypothetical protein
MYVNRGTVALFPTFSRYSRCAVDGASKRCAIWLALGVVCAGLGGCQDGDARLRAEAERFVELYAQVKYDAPPAERKQKLDALAQAVFVSDEVSSARDVCLSGHRSLLEAQETQDATAAEIDRALAATEGAKPFDPTMVERLQRKLEQSQRSLNLARNELRDCEARVRALDVRFGKRFSR